MKNILVICGPTASGKTSLALSIASSLRDSYSNRSNLTPPPSVNILSADSRQIYRGLEIVTGKDIPSDLPQNISFFGLDLVEPDQLFNLSDFVNYSQKIIHDSLTQNIPLIIVGGTGLYLKAITSDLLNVHVPPDPDLRHDLERLDIKSLQSRLLELYPNKLASLNNSDLHNPRRLIRAIEIAASTITSVIPGSDPESRHVIPPVFQWIGLKQDKEIQKAKIRQRVLNRLDSGAIEEVKTLLNKYPDRSLPIYTSLGVKEIVQYLEKDISRDKLIDQWILAESDYARRQMVWFNKQPGIFWYDKSTVDSHLVAKLAAIYKK